MRILSVASFLPYPPDDATRNRAWNFVIRLARSHHVTLVTWVPPGRERYVEEVRDRVTELIAVPMAPVSRGIPKRVINRLESFVRTIPPFMVERMATHPIPVLKEPFDLAIAEDDGAAWLLPSVDAPVVVHRHNVFTRTIEGLRESGALGRYRRLKWTMELPAWRNFDVGLSASADLNLVTTPEAKAELGKFLPPGSWIEVCENGADLAPQISGAGENRRAVFVGTMSYEPNADAAVRFSRSVWPLVTARCPDARLEIIGRDPLPQVQGLRVAGVTVRGEVDDVVESCRGARMGIVPLYAGSGIKTKTLELMSQGLPVVATRLGAEGISATADDGLLVADDDDSLAEGIVRLMADRDLASRLGGRAREFIRNHYSWDRATESYERLLEDVLRRSGASVDGVGSRGVDAVDR